MGKSAARSIYIINTMKIFLLITIILIPLIAKGSALLFTQSFDGVTVDMLYPNGYKEKGTYSQRDSTPVSRTLWGDRFNPSDIVLISKKDGSFLSVAVQDSVCYSDAGIYPQTDCISYVNASVYLNFSVKANEISVSNPFNVSIYAKYEMYGNCSRNAAGASCNNFTRFYVQVYNFTGSRWDTFYQNTTGSSEEISYENWFNISVNNSTRYTLGGIVRVRIFAEAQDFSSYQNLGQSMCGASAYIRLYVDYVEGRLNVPDSNTTRVCVGVNRITYPKEWGDVIHNETLSFLLTATTTGGSPVPNFPVKVNVTDEYGNQQTVAIGVTNSSGITPFVRVVGGEAYRAKFSKIEAWDRYMINNNAYVKDSSCGEVPLNPTGDGTNVSIVPARYILNLVGRMYYPGGVDWARFVWYIEDTSVIRHRNIPISQKFTNNSTSFTVWKYGFDYNCTDNSTPCDREGLYGNVQTPDWNGACIAIGRTDDYMTPYCSRPPTGFTFITARLTALGFIVVRIAAVQEAPNCYMDPYGLHRCGFLSGYRVGPLIQINIPDNALGWTASLAIQDYGGSLRSFMANTNYSHHESPGTLRLGTHRINLCGVTATTGAANVGSSEYAFSRTISVPTSALGGLATGTSYIEPDTKGGLGLIGFFGLYGDQKHVVGVILGHRFGIHPFVALVQTVPYYPTTQAGWTNYEHLWLYYLYENLRFIAETWGKEMSIWNYRYNNATNQANLVRAFEDLIVEFTPFLKTTLDLMVSAPRTLVYPFVVSVFLNLGDFGYLMKVSYSNQTIFNKAVEASEALMRNLGNILGPPPPNCSIDPTWNDPNSYQCYGLNFIWSGSRLLSYSERELFAYRLMELFSTIIDLQIELMKAIPELNNSSSPWAYPKWNYNWIHPE